MADAPMSRDAQLLATRLADYLESHRWYESLSKRDVVLQAVAVLTGHEWAAFELLEALPSKVGDAAIVDLSLPGSGDLVVSRQGEVRGELERAVDVEDNFYGDIIGEPPLYRLVPLNQKTKP